MLVEKQAASVGLREPDVLDVLASQNVRRLLAPADVLDFWKSAPLRCSTSWTKTTSSSESSTQPPKRPSAHREGGRTLRPLRGRPSNGSVSSATRSRCRERAAPRAGRRDRGPRRPPDSSGCRPRCPTTDGRRAVRRPRRSGVHEALIFSSWSFVPRAVAAFLSYEAERLMVGRSGAGANTPEARKRRARCCGSVGDLRPSRRDAGARSHYPSAYLAKAFDPAHRAETAADGIGVSSVDIARILGEAESIIEVALTRLRVAPVLDGQEDERWYWAAPATARPSSRARGNQGMVWPTRLAASAPVPQRPASAAGPDAPKVTPRSWDDHVPKKLALETDARSPLGKAPADLVTCSHESRVGAPGVSDAPVHAACRRHAHGRPRRLCGVRVRNGAAQSAWSFRGLFNQTEVMSLLEGEPPYWRQVLDYCVDGCLQAVLDEYDHVLRESSGPRGRRCHRPSAPDRARDFRGHVAADGQPGRSDLGLTGLGGRYGHRRDAHALSLRHCDSVTNAPRMKDRDSARDSASGRRSTRRSGRSWSQPRRSGQDGLDFHTYCHAVVHWNLADQSGRSGAARRPRSPFQGARRPEERRACPRNREHQGPTPSIRGSRCSRKRDGGAPMGPPM